MSGSDILRVPILCSFIGVVFSACGMVYCGMVYCGMVYCGMVYCGMVYCGMVYQYCWCMDCPSVK